MLTPPKDFTPTAETISLHGLGFIQVKLGGKQRLHVWHPELPRRACYQHSAIHNHRFSFKSTVLIGHQTNRMHKLVMHPEGTHEVISHDGARSERGGRQSFVAGRVNVVSDPTESYKPGETYFVPELAYHDTPNDGVVVTLMTKMFEGAIHACSVIERPHAFDQDFDRFQLDPDDLWTIVIRALEQ